MADKHSKEVRHYNMSRIRSKDTMPEKTVRSFLFSKGLRFRKNDKRYPGHPDVLLPKYRTAIFIHGCFWHVHEGCSDLVMPKTNEEFWINKLSSNKERDNKNIKELRHCGWNVIVVWECELKKRFREVRLSKLYDEIIGNNSKEC